MKEEVEKYALERAQKRVEELKGFYQHLAIYIIAIIIMFVVNQLVEEWRFEWFLVSVLGWGVGLTLHAAKAFRWFSFFGKNWEEQKIKEIMDKNSGKSKMWE